MSQRIWANQTDKMPIEEREGVKKIKYQLIIFYVCAKNRFQRSIVSLMF